MDITHFRRVTGVLLIVGAVVVNIPYALLISNFEYPDILRAPTAEILSKFAAGGPGLVFTWLAFAWAGLPILIGVLRLPEALRDGSQTGKSALVFGAIGVVAQMIGLLRWAFVVPALARMHESQFASDEMRAAVAVAFQTVHRYGGVLIGEHIGQSFTILWMLLLSVTLLRSRSLPRWVPITGIASGVVYLLAQGEVLATAVPTFPTWDAAGLIGSLLWIGWLVVIGVMLLRKEKSTT